MVKNFIPFLLVFLALSRASAETEEQLSLEQCLKAAAEASPSVESSFEALKSAEFNVKVSEGALLPSISGSGRFSRSGTDDSESDQDQSSVGLNLDHTFFSGHSLKASVRQARSQEIIAEADYQVARAESGEAVRRAFAVLLFTQEQLDLARVTAERRGQNADLVALRFQTGKEHKGSHLLSQANYKQALFEVEAARRDNRVAQRDLAGAMGRSMFDVLIATGSLVSTVSGDAPEFRRLMFDTPEYRKALESIRSAEAQVTVANSPFYPEIGGFASVARSGDDWRPEDNSWSVGLSLGFSFFDARRDFNRVNAAKAEVRRQEAELRKTANELILNLESTWSALKDAVERVAVQRAFLDAAELRAEIGRNQYTGGLLSFEDWDVIENDLISARKSMLTTSRDAVLAEAAWDRACGRSPLPDL